MMTVIEHVKGLGGDRGAVSVFLRSWYIFPESLGAMLVLNMPSFSYGIYPACLLFLFSLASGSARDCAVNGGASFLL